MAYSRPSEAIFSPSVARLASSTAKDWNYVDSWLASKLQTRPPAFERNPETLKALVALAAFNEPADDERELFTRIETTALEKFPVRTTPKDSDVSVPAILENITTTIEQELPREGQAALDAICSAAVELGIAYPEPEALGCEIAQMQARLFQLDEVAKRVATLQEHIEEESAKACILLQELEDGEYRPAANLAKTNLDLQRKVKTGTASLQETRERAAKIGTHAKLTVQQVQKEESLYLDLLAHKKDLDTQIKSFQGLPPDKDLARQQLEALRKELHSITQKRDIVFEGLVERETPRKHK